MKKLLSIIFSVSLILVLAGCNEEVINKGGNDQAGRSDELPVAFDLSMPENVITRSFLETDNVKRVFSENDVIHLLGTFNVKYGDENNPQEEIVKRYGALRFDGRQWNAVEGSTLTWPSMAVDGQFIAYYISESNGILTPDNPTAEYLLSDLDPSSDPLYAVSASGIPYGYAVGLNFNHLCAYLTLINMEPLVSDSYWFSSVDGIFQDPESQIPMALNNAFKITLGSDTDQQPTLNFEFTQSPNPQYGNGIYIIGTPYTQTDNEGNPIGDTRVSYFLQPAYYESFNIEYPSTPPTTYAYLKYDYTNIPANNGGEGVMNNEPNLQAGLTYTLDITKSPGISIENPSSGTGWDESNTYFEVDPEEFLKSITEGKKYEYTDPDTGSTVLILEDTPVGTQLLHNVDFQNIPYSSFVDQGFLPTLREGLVFDGGLHYIRNLADPLFRYNSGTIKNLGIKDVDAAIVSYESEIANEDNSRNGALCKWNLGTINNIRVYGVTLNVYVKSIESTEVHNIGGVVGSNSGEINEVELSGTFTINVTGLTVDNTANIESEMDYPVNATVIIGGICGQNAGNGKIDETTTKTPFSLTITNTCQGNTGNYNIGGIAGKSTGGTVSNISLPQLVINSSESHGIVSYIGGMIGQIEAESSCTLTGSNVGGNITAGTSSYYGAVTSGAYTGGMVGAVLNGTVNNCNSAVTVTGPQTLGAQIYGTGGIFGRIRNSSSYNFSSLYGWGNGLTGPQDYIGNFAGIVPDDQAWNEWWPTFEIRNITVRQFVAKDNGYAL